MDIGKSQQNERSGSAERGWITEMKRDANTAGGELRKINDICKDRGHRRKGDKYAQSSGVEKPRSYEVSCLD